MKIPERWPLYAKWFVVWLVILPMILHRVSSGLFGLLVVALAVGLAAHLVDRIFSFLCDCVKRH
ncbi:hypothetical protein [Salmonella enterica]|uniref:Uncharacterized protein n=4 Tax=Salmonella enterica TaxID=28901 RepID=A0A8F6XX24_SALET|nr:hypothetical protein [Salmonella enterica]EAB9738622.1 hypothetical protein [Salmonella enterica subsp. diarizonae]EDQ7380349.1 hypothetical protein [Salmonella enterica subsp. diarizonae serovar 35:l,v:z35]EDS4948871.1 hypothetical protein [Salmonella enterica subsp. enterica serovar Redlands]EDT6982553.1 hypothetical protein [Salmonella enterica subsp. arizonae]EDW0435336.1 hypothetical protein [Salmonella enterica subsp. enterica serovar Lexington]EDW0630830.1 hypothetical protein [Salm